jgi:predicted phosphodiesterase
LKLGFIADIHSNVEALDAVLSVLEKENVDRTICLGDVVGYGPDPNACVEKILKSADVVIAGNHDRAAVGMAPLEHFNDDARTAIEWTREALVSPSSEILAGLPLVYEEDDMLAVHATPNEPAKWHYLFSEAEIIANLEALTLPYCFIGHSHVPVVFVLNADHGVQIQSAEEVRFEAGKKFLINVGSVGQPRDGDPRAAVGILHDGRFFLKRVQYDVERVQQKMQKLSLPRRLIERLSKGI